MRKYLVAMLIFWLLAWSHAQNDNPVSVRLESYIVSEVTGEDGNRQERFTAASAARPGQVVEYRLFVTNNDETTLPSGTVVILGPIPETTRYVDNSATPSSERVLTEFSADGGQSFSEAPLLQTLEDGSEEVIDPSAYTTVRWTVLQPLEPAMELSFFYRVVVN